MSIKWNSVFPVLLGLLIAILLGCCKKPQPLPTMTEVAFSKPLQVSETEFAAEVSGLCLSKDGDFLWGVGDKGELFKIQFDGTYTKYGFIDADLEGITLDPSTGDLYLAIEPDSVFKVSAPEYSVHTTLFGVADAKEMGNSGIEGIAWHDGSLYLGAQTDAMLWQVSLDGQVQDKKSLCTVTSTLSEVADLCYDPERDFLWVLDSRGKSEKHPERLPYTLYLFNGEATQLLATYDLSAFANINPEAVCIDRKNGCIWVADDCGKKHPAILHKILFSNL